MRIELDRGVEREIRKHKFKDLNSFIEFIENAVRDNKNLRSLKGLRGLYSLYIGNSTYLILRINRDRSIVKVLKVVKRDSLYDELRLCL